MGCSQLLSKHGTKKERWFTVDILPLDLFVTQITKSVASSGASGAVELSIRCECTDLPVDTRGEAALHPRWR